jgi:hypothetical protein
MATFTRTWYWLEEYAVSQGSGHQDQVQDMFLNLHNFILGITGIDKDGAASAAGAWTLVQSNVGGDATAPDSNNNITAKTHVVNDTWATYSKVIDGQEYMFGWECTNVTTGACTWRVFNTTSPATAGTDTAMPNDTNAHSLANFTTLSPTDDSDVGRTLNCMRSSGGDLVLLGGEDGTGEVQFAFICYAAPTGGQPGITWSSAFYGFSASGGAVDSGNIQTVGQTRTWNEDDSKHVNTLLTSVLGQNASWTASNGLSTLDSSALAVPPAIVADNGGDRVFWGFVVDLKVGPEGLSAVNNYVDPSDTDDVVYLSAGDMWLPARQGVSRTW